MAVPTIGTGFSDVIVESIQGQAQWLTESSGISIEKYLGTLSRVMSQTKRLPTTGGGGIGIQDWSSKSIKGVVMIETERFAADMTGTGNQPSDSSNDILYKVDELLKLGEDIVVTVGGDGDMPSGYDTTAAGVTTEDITFTSGIGDMTITIPSGSDYVCNQNKNMLKWNEWAIEFWTDTTTTDTSNYTTDTVDITEFSDLTDQIQTGAPYVIRKQTTMFSADVGELWSLTNATVVEFAP